MRLPHYDPETSYSTNNLYIPRGSINERILQATLTFQVGEEDEIEEGTNMRTGRKVPKYLRLWDANRNHIIVPRHFLHGQDLSAFNVVRAEPRYEEIDLPDTIVPRPTQVKALVHMEHHRMGTVNLACVAGDTKLSLNRGGKGFKMPIARAYERLHYEGRYQWDTEIPTMIRARMEDRLGLHEIEDIIYRGKRLTETLVLEDGKELRLTSDHQVLTTKGWKSIDQGLQPGDLVYVDGKREGSTRKPKRAYKRLSWYRSHPFVRIQQRKGRKESIVLEEHRAVAEAELNGLSLEEYRERCRAGKVKGLVFIDPTTHHVHHIDENIMNNHPDNLEVLEKEAHLSGHRPGHKAFGYGVPTPVKVKAITAGKFEDVYDVVCKDPHHNFVANGIVVHNCGKGKTVLALHYIVKRRRPGIVFVNQEALMDQWANEIREFIGDVDIGIIKGKKWDWEDKPITIAMVQTVAQKPERWTRSFRERFGVVFYDEGHHMAAPLFNTTASLFYGDRFGLTATPYRGDGLENIYMYHLGPIIYQDLEQDLIPETFFHQTNLEVPKKDSSKIRDKAGQEHHGKLCSYLGSRRDRNEAILERIMEDWAAGRKMLVVSHSVDHAVMLYEMMNRPAAGLITGSVSDAEGRDNKDRIDILLNCNPVFGTFQLTREGLNKKELDCLHICTSFSSSNDLQQSFGRIQRAKDGKPDPFVRIWEDPNIKMSRNQCNRLRTYLRALGYPFDFVQERI